jgi:TRAP-type C4-dicarboxylate transport system permease small subunit
MIQDRRRLPILDRLSEWIFLATGLAVLATALMITYDVLMRYFLNRPQLFVDELTSFLLVGIIFLGAAPTFHRGGHIRIDLITRRLSRKMQKKLRIVTLSAGIVILAVVSYETAVSAVMAFRYERMSAVMLYPVWIGMMLIPVGLSLMGLFMLAKMINIIESKTEDPEKRF